MLEGAYIERAKLTVLGLRRSAQRSLHRSPKLILILLKNP